jgi:chemotaxis protein CheX
MEVKYINPFLTAVKKVFDTMIEVPFVLGKPVIKKDGIPPHEISGIIGLSGDITGSVVISLEENIALELASALLGDEFTEINDDCTDAIGEIANMIAGNAKTDFPGKNNAISVPTVVVGKHKLSYPKGIPIISIPCKAGKGELTIDIAIKTT